GALGLECRTEDVATHEILQKLEDPSTRRAVEAERAVLRTLGGGCQVPIGVLAVAADGVIQIRAVVLSPDGRQQVQAELEGAAADASLLGQQLAQDLLVRGARELLQSR